MNALFRFPLPLLLFLFPVSNVNSQGCSDAGFCTINMVKPEEKDSTDKINEVKLGISAGKADHSITVLASYLEYKRVLSRKFSIAAKVTALSQVWTSYSSAGLSDLFLTGAYTGVKNTFFTGGVKIPFNKANRTRNGFSLPMDLQTSLGTYDLILGAGYKIVNFRFALAWQQPFTQNENTFLPADFLYDIFGRFQPTNGYIRKGDVLVRATYAFRLGKKLSVIPGLLPVYHLADDQFVNDSGHIQSIEGSQGLTLNGNLFIEYSLSDSHLLELSFGKPFIFRKARPDGLTRHYIANLQYKVNF